jgi:hypothetical protein
MMPGVVAGFPRKAETPGEYVITRGTNEFGYSGYSGYSGNVSDGPFGSSHPPKPSADPMSTGGSETAGELMAVYWSEGQLSVLVRGVSSEAGIPFSTMTIGSAAFSKSAATSFASYGAYSRLNFNATQNPFSSASVTLKFT